MATIVPGSMTAIPPAVNTHITTMGRCPRCERWTWEIKCPGVMGEITHLGS